MIEAKGNLSFFFLSAGKTSRLKITTNTHISQFSRTDEEHVNNMNSLSGSKPMMRVRVTESTFNSPPLYSRTHFLWHPKKWLSILLLGEDYTGARIYRPFQSRWFPVVFIELSTNNWKNILKLVIYLHIRWNWPRNMTLLLFVILYHNKNLNLLNSRCCLWCWTWIYENSVPKICELTHVCWWHYI